MEPSRTLALTDRAVDLVRGIVVQADGTEVRLSTREVEVLRYFAQRPGQIITRDELLVEVWGYSPTVLSRAADICVARLRPKIELDPSNPAHLITVHGTGYRFEFGRSAEAPQGAVAAARPAARQRLHLPSCTIDLQQNLVERGGETHRLNTTEARLLCVLIAHNGAVVSRADLQRAVWGQTGAGTTRTIDNTVMKLRSQIEADPSDPAHILTAWGEGFRFVGAAEAPSGELALVVTDIQGSSAMWAALEDRFVDALAVFDEVMRRCLAAHQGYEARSDSDSSMLAFQRPIDAARFCLAAQQQWFQADWPASLEDPVLSAVCGPDADRGFRGMRVRMGMHSCTPIAQVHPATGRMDYMGPETDRVFRLTRTAHGGQVLLSGAAWAAIEPDLAAIDAAHIDLGQHVLPQVWVREHVHQLLPTMVASRAFPPLRATEVPRTNLAPVRSPFFGRTSVLDQIGDAVAEGHRLITITGTAGSGKTRLVERFGRDRYEAFSGGVWMCDLTEARSAIGVISAVASAMALALTAVDEEALLTHVGHVLAGRGDVLVILDNFEHLVDIAPGTVGQWLKTAPNATFLTTSRQRLGLSGERIIAIRSLPLPAESDAFAVLVDNPAVALFVARAQAVDGKFELTEDNATHVAAIVHELDGLPLAIELAAAWVHVLSPQDMEVRLATSRTRTLGPTVSYQGLLESGSRTRHPPKSATMRGAIDWSWDLLEPWEQRALAQCSVFRGGFSLDAAEAVIDLTEWAEAPSTLRVVQTLVDQSLLHSTQPFAGCKRLGMVKSIHDYATERLRQSGAREASAHQHAGHYAKLGSPSQLRELRTHGGIERQRQLALERENLLAAVESGLAEADFETAFACGHAAVWVFRRCGPYAGGVALADRLRKISGAPEPLRARAAFLHGFMLVRCGQTEAARIRLEEAAELAKQVGNRSLESRAINALGMTLARTVRMEEAVQRYEEALAIAKADSDGSLEADCHANIATLFMLQGNLEVAMAHLRAAMNYYEASGDLSATANLVDRMANLLSRQGDLDGAQSAYNEALMMSRKIANRSLEGITLGNLALLLNQRGLAPQARDHLERALAIHREIGNRPFEGVALGNLGDLLLEMGDLSSAERQLREAIAIMKVSFSGAAGAFSGSLALLRARCDDLEEARILLDDGEERLRGSDSFELGKLLCKRAEVEHIAGEADSAIAALDEATRIADDLALDETSELVVSIQKTRQVLGLE
jgi:DNA-binding response OmpR family regulator/predicted ATPase/Tfp pilus assembly protein PilF